MNNLSERRFHRYAVGANEFDGYALGERIMVIDAVVTEYAVGDIIFISDFEFGIHTGRFIVVRVAEVVHRELKRDGHPGVSVTVLRFSDVL